MSPGKVEIQNEAPKTSEKILYKKPGSYLLSWGATQWTVVLLGEGGRALFGLGMFLWVRGDLLSASVILIGIFWCG